MAALATELSAFTMLLVDDASERSCQEPECPLREDCEARPTSGECAGATLSAAHVHGDSTPGLPAVKSSVRSAPAMQSLVRVMGRKPPVSQSKYQKLLRANPPKAAPVRSAKHNIRPGERARTHAKVREILSSPVLWKEYQSKSFQQHIKRQQQARALMEQESLAAETATAAHYKRAQYALQLNRKDTSVATERQPPSGLVRRKTVYSATYLQHFWQGRRRGLESPRTAGASESPSAATNQSDSDALSPEANSLLCGVYVYGKRRLGLAYFTCSTLEQLVERVCARFRIASVLNLYRERTVATTALMRTGDRRARRPVAKTFQRITAFEQVRDGDRLCVTQDAYEDMAILCAWIQQRQVRVYRMAPQTQANTDTSSQRSATEQGSVDQATSSAAPLKAPAHASTITSANSSNSLLWDANGRSVAIKKQLNV